MIILCYVSNYEIKSHAYATGEHDYAAGYFDVYFLLSPLVPGLDTSSTLEVFQGRGHRLQ